MCTNRFKLVRRIRTKGHVTEKDFWSNFFFRVKLVKDSMSRFQSLGDPLTELPDTIDKEYVQKYECVFLMLISVSTTGDAHCIRS